MMDLVLEQVQQKAIRPLLLNVCAPVNVDDPVRSRFVQPLAPGNQPAINLCLRRPQFRNCAARHTIRPGGRPERAAFQRINVEPIDDQDMIQRGLDRREQAVSSRWFAQALLYAIARNV